MAFSLCICHASRALLILNADFAVDVYIKSSFQTQMKFKAGRCFLKLKKLRGFPWAELINFQPVLKAMLRNSEMHIYWNKTIQSRVSLCSCSMMTTMKIISLKAFRSVFPSSCNRSYVFFIKANSYFYFLSSFHCRESPLLLWVSRQRSSVWSSFVSQTK